MKIFKKEESKKVSIDWGDSGSWKCIPSLEEGLKDWQVIHVFNSLMGFGGPSFPEKRLGKSFMLWVWTMGGYPPGTVMTWNPCRRD